MKPQPAAERSFTDVLTKTSSPDRTVVAGDQVKVGLGDEEIRGVVDRLFVDADEKIACEIKYERKMVKKLDEVTNAIPAEDMGGGHEYFRGWRNRAAVLEKSKLRTPHLSHDTHLTDPGDALKVA